MIDSHHWQAEPSEALKQQIIHEKVIDVVLKNLKVTRSGLTYVIEIGYQTNDPQKATLIANTYADKISARTAGRSKFDATERRTSG